MLTSESFQISIDQSRWYQPGGRILCACSGGLDSTVLLHLLHQIPGIELGVVHFDHQLRGRESRVDADFVKQIAQEYELPFYLLSEDVGAYARDHQFSIEEGGSILRRRGFTTLCQTAGYDHVATAQHANDQLETILINLISGTGIRGLAGIHSAMGQFLRPLIPWTRSAITSYAVRHKLVYRVDATNTDSKFLRNNVRNNLIPMLSDQSSGTILDNILRIQTQATRLSDQLEHSIEVIDNTDISDSSSFKISLGLSKLPGYFAPIQKMIFDKAFQSLTGAQQGLSHQHFTALRSLYPISSIAKRIPLPQGNCAVRDRRKITLLDPRQLKWSPYEYQNVAKVQFPFFSIELSYAALGEHIKDPNYFWLTDLQESLWFRPVKPEHRLYPALGKRTISINKILQSAKVALHLKNWFPVCMAGDEILWVPGIRTAAQGLLDVDTVDQNELRACLKVSFLKGTFDENA